MSTKATIRFLATAVIMLLASSAGGAGSESLVRAMWAVIDSADPNDWPDRCHEYVDDFDPATPEPAASRLAPLAANSSDEPALPVVIWNGIRIPLLDTQFTYVKVVPGSLATLGSESGMTAFSSLDLSAHFDHFENIPGLDQYSGYRSRLIDWIDDGLSLESSNLECRPETLTRDMTTIVHSLMTSIAVLVPDNARLLRIDQPYSALLIASNEMASEQASVRYIVQLPDRGTSRMIELVYRFKQTTGAVQALRAIETAIRAGVEFESSARADLVRALLDADYERAAESAEGLDLEFVRFDW